MAFGVFDLLHSGHVKYLQAAKQLGDYLIVVVTPDKNAKKSGKKLVHSQEERRFVVSSLKCVDEAVVGFETDFYNKTLLEYKPDVLALGYDMQEKEQELEKLAKQLGLRVQVARMPAFDPQKNKSSHIKKKIRESNLNDFPR